jgi:hypothetical protein
LPHVLTKFILKASIKRMKYLIRILLAYPRMIVASVLILSFGFGMTMPAYAATADSGPITCSGGPSLSTSTISAHNGQGEKCFIQSYVNPFVKVLAAMVAIFVVLSIIIASIQYSAAADDSSKVSAAKNRIRNALIALLAYVFLLTFVKYLLPGGL